MTIVVLLAVAYAAAVAAAAVGGGGAWAAATGAAPATAAAGLALPPVSAVEVFLGFAVAARAPRVVAWAAARRAAGRKGGGGGLLGLLAAARTAWAVATGVAEVARDAALYAFVLFGVLAVVERVVGAA